MFRADWVVIDGVGSSAFAALSSLGTQLRLHRDRGVASSAKWANRHRQESEQTRGTVLAEHLHCAGFEVDVTPPQAVPFLIIETATSSALRTAE